MSLKHIANWTSFLHGATSFVFCLEVPGSILTITIQTTTLVTRNQKQETFKTDGRINPSPANPQSKITK